MSESENISIKDLDTAITKHLNKLNNMEIMGKLIDRKTKQNSDIKSRNSLSTDSNNNLEYWSDNVSPFMDKNINFNTESPSKWIYKSLNNIPNTSHTSCSILYSKIDPNNVHHNNLILNVEIEKDIKQNNGERKCLLHRIRNKFAKFQAAQGISNDEYTFAALLKIMGQATAKSLLALFYFIISVIPMTMILLFILRFTLDKVLDIQQTKDRQQIALKTIFLALQIFFIYLCLTFVFGLIWLPTFQIVIRIMKSCLINPTYN